MPRTDERDGLPPIRPAQLVEAMLFVPIGLGVSLIGDAPRRLRQMRSDLAAARFIGELAVTEGASRLRDRLSDGSDVAPATAPPARSGPGPVHDVVDETGDGEIDARQVPSAGVAGADDVDAGDVDAIDGDASDHDDAGDDVPDVAELAIPDFDTVPAIDVVAQLGDLEPAERDRIKAYELAHRGRRTVLGKIAQLEDAP